MSRERRYPTGAQLERREQTAQLVSGGFEGLVKELEQGQSEKFLKYLEFCAKFHHYSPYNQMLIWLQSPEATYVAGFQKWKQLGHAVRKGEKGIAILAPLIVKNTDENDLDDTKLIGFKVVYVFDASQLAGNPTLPSLIEPLADDSEALFESLRQTVEATGITVRLERLGPGVHGASEGGEVVISSEWDSQNRTHSLLHEWAHEIVHRTWISATERRHLSTTVRECQAEAVAYIVAKYLGLANPFSRDYLQLYGVDAQLLVDNLDVVQQASHHIIECIEHQRDNASGIAGETTIFAA